jgi:nucleotide-binding universal stress UspA family protein
MPVCSEGARCFPDVLCAESSKQVRLIVVPVANRPECRVALDAAFGLAATLQADVAAYHIRPQRREETVALAPLLPDDDVHAALAVADSRARSRSKAAQSVYRRAAARHGFVAAKRPRRGARLRAFWREAAGTPARVFAVIGPVADLSVVSRPSAAGASLARAFMLGALLHSAKPVLVMPQEARATLGKKIAIAWNQSADAASAVSAALPLLTRAERVVVVSAGRENRLGPKTAHLARYLAHWDVEVERKRTPGRHVEKEIEQACRDLDSDLLVMGAYSRSRWRQVVFGGVTEHMLFKSELPVLLLHH